MFILLPLFRQMSWFDRLHRHGHRGGVDSGGAGFVCYPVRARRQRCHDCSTLDAEHSGAGASPAFRSSIRSPRGSFPKPAISRINPGWQVCVVESLFTRPAASSDRHVSAKSRDVARTVAVAAPASTARASVPIGWWWLPLLADHAGHSWIVFQGTIDRTEMVGQTLETFAAAFIREFERPLIDERCAQSALHAELASVPAYQRSHGGASRASRRKTISESCGSSDECGIRHTSAC